MNSKNPKDEIVNPELKTQDSRFKSDKSTLPDQSRGKSAPTDPVPQDQYSPHDQSLLIQTMPASGWALARVISPEERHNLGFSEKSQAYLPAVMMEIINLNGRDDSFRREYPIGTLVWASLEEIAPLLQTKLYLLPLGRIMGSWGQHQVDNAQGIGFHH